MTYYVNLPSLNSKEINDNEFPDWLIETICTRDYYISISLGKEPITKNELIILFTDGYIINNDLNKYLINRLDWNKNAIYHLFGDSTIITKKIFIDKIRKILKPFNDKCNDIEFHKKLFYFNENEDWNYEDIIGKKFQEYDTINGERSSNDIDNELLKKFESLEENIKKDGLLEELFNYFKNIEGEPDIWSYNELHLCYSIMYVLPPKGKKLKFNQEELNLRNIYENKQYLSYERLPDILKVKYTDDVNSIDENEKYKESNFYTFLFYFFDVKVSFGRIGIDVNENYIEKKLIGMEFSSIGYMSKYFNLIFYFKPEKSIEYWTGSSDYGFLQYKLGVEINSCNLFYYIINNFETYETYKLDDITYTYTQKNLKKDYNIPIYYTYKKNIPKTMFATFGYQFKKSSLKINPSNGINKKSHICYIGYRVNHNYLSRKINLTNLGSYIRFGINFEDNDLYGLIGLEIFSFYYEFEIIDFNIQHSIGLHIRYP